MKIEITDSPVTLYDALKRAGYEWDTARDAGVGVLLSNDTRTYDAAAGVTLPGDDEGPVFIEGCNLNKHDGNVDTTSNGNSASFRGTETFERQGWGAAQSYDNLQRGIGTEEYDKKYITADEATPIFNGERFPFTCYDPKRVHLVSCPGKTVCLKVFME